MQTGDRLTSESAGLSADEHLLGLLAQQRDLYRALRDLSDRQRALIDGDRPELLLNILHDRQGLVAALARLNDELAPFRRNWDEQYTALPPDVQRLTSALLAEISGLLRAILKSDQDDSALLSIRKQSAGNELAGLNSARRANAAYAVATAPAASAGLTG